MNTVKKRVENVTLNDIINEVFRDKFLCDDIIF